jgi:ParB family chromosome partitioning protein
MATRYLFEAARQLSLLASKRSAAFGGRNGRQHRIAENLHRAELTKLERDGFLSEWISLRDQSAQTEPIESKRVDGKGHRPQSGINSASRELGIDRTDLQRAIKVASLSDEAKEAARDIG